MDQIAITPLADLIRRKNALDEQIAAIVQRPALIGHVGEYVAAAIFDIELHESAVTKGSDGIFRGAPERGASVNIKWYGKHENILDINVNGVPDYYLVMTGPRGDGTSSKGMTRPWSIDMAFLFRAADLLSELRSRQVKVGVATSVLSRHWEQAEIYPHPRSPLLDISENQQAALRLFRYP